MLTENVKFSCYSIKNVFYVEKNSLFLIYMNLSLILRTLMGSWIKDSFLVREMFVNSVGLSYMFPH